VKCKICNSDFYAKPRHLKIGWGKYCSNPCSYQAMHTGKWVKCNTCSKRIYRQKRELKASKSGKLFCNKSCFAVWKNKNIMSGERHVNWKNGENAYRSIMLRSKALQVCNDCGIKDIKVLVVHHIDQNRKNNKLNNLKWLCRNCHYVVHEGKTV
jgi:hypothetical protein